LALLAPAVRAAETGATHGRVVDEAWEPIDVVEEFVRHALRRQFEPAAAVSTSSESRVKENRIVQQVHEDGKNQVYWSAADGHVEDDRAVVLFVRRPRDEAQKRSVEAINAIRVGGSWKVDLASPSASENTASDESVRILRAWMDDRTKEILSVVNARTLPSYPMSGTWSTHYRQTHLVLILSSDGQATIITIREGSHGIDIYDYHLEGETIVIEARSGPIRLKRGGQCSKGVDGQVYPYLITEQPGMLGTLFPSETIRLTPVGRWGSSVRRPKSVFEDRRLHDK
jgi:hypothetical protein